MATPEFGAQAIRKVLRARLEAAEFRGQRFLVDQGRHGAGRASKASKGVLTALGVQEAHRSDLGQLPPDIKEFKEFLAEVVSARRHRRRQQRDRLHLGLHDR